MAMDELVPEAFAYYLPAYLMFAARDPDRIGEMVLYSLGPSAGARAAQRRSACAYSREQLRLIVELAEMIAGDDSEHFGRFRRDRRVHDQRSPDSRMNEGAT
jgi:hypothetical protein